MVSAQSPLRAMRGSLFHLTLCFAAVPASAQYPVLAPTVDTSIVVTGPLHYSSIHIPPGVTVRFVLPPNTWPIPFTPAVVRCDGDAIVHGTLSVAGDTVNGYGFPAGLVTTDAP